MFTRSPLTTAQTTTDLAGLQDNGNAAISQPKRRTGPRRRLAHLVSKFEGLDGMSRLAKPLPPSRTAIAQETTSNARLIGPPSAPSSISTLSLSSPTKSTRRTKDSALLDVPASDYKTQLGVPVRKSDTTDKNSSVVAERRKLFEVKLGDVESDAAANSTSSANVPTRQHKKLRLPSKWQTVRARSPLACLAQSQAAVLSRPNIPNVSKRLSGYVPLSSTCPALQSVDNSNKVHRLSTCGIHSAKENDHGRVTPSATANPGRQIGGLADQHVAVPKQSDEKSAQLVIKECPSQSTHSRSSSVKSRHTGIASLTKLSHDGGGEEATQSPELVKPPPALSVNKIRSKLPLRNHINRRSNGQNYAPSHSPSPIRLHKEKNVESVVAQLEATPNKRTIFPPSQIGNKIGHFESLIAKDKTDPKYSIGHKLRIPASASCQVMKPDNQLKLGRMEETRRKFSSSWGPARWRKSRIIDSSETVKHIAQSANKSGDRRLDGQYIPADGSTEAMRPMSDNWDFWMDNPDTSKRQKGLHGSLPPHSVDNRLKFSTLQAQASPAASNRHAPEKEHGYQNMELDREDKRRSWRLSGRRWMSRSTAPLVARADCALEQPQPMRVNEMRRLVSLCRDKMTGRKDRPQTD